MYRYGDIPTLEDVYFTTLSNDKFIAQPETA